MRGTGRAGNERKLAGNCLRMAGERNIWLPYLVGLAFTYSTRLLVSFFSCFVSFRFVFEWPKRFSDQGRPRRAIKTCRNHRSVAFSASLRDSAMGFHYRAQSVTAISLSRSRSSVSAQLRRHRSLLGTDTNSSHDQSSRRSPLVHKRTVA